MGSGALGYAGGRIQANRPVSLLHPPPPYVFLDFIGDAVDTFQTILTQSGTPTTAGGIDATAGDPVAGHGGWFAGATDDVDAEADELAVGAASATAGIFRADRVGTGMLVCEWAVTIPGALTTRQYFAGLSDDATEGSGAIAINVTTTTVADTATDAAGFCFGSAATDNTHWLGVSTDGGAQSTITATTTATADTWVGLRVEIDINGDVNYLTRATRGGPLTGWGKSNTGTSPDVLLLPYFAASPTTTTAVPWEVDYCFATAAPI